KKDKVVNDQRRGRIDRGVHSGPPGKLKPGPSAVWIERGQAGASEEESVAQTFDGGGDWRGIAGFVVRGLPAHLPCALLESDDARALRAADVQQHGLAFDERRADHAEETFRCPELGLRVDAPNLFAGREVETVQQAFGAEGEDLSFRNRRRRPRAFVETKVVAVTGGIIKAPEQLAGAGIEAFDGFLVADSMEQNQAAAGNRRAAEALADFFPPDNWRTLFGPRFSQVGAGINAVACRAKKLRPIAGARAGQDEEREQTKQRSAANSHRARID